MSLFDSSVQHPLGATVGRPIIVEAYNRTGSAVVAGDVVQFDLNQVNSEVTSIDEGVAASIFANFLIPVATASGVGIGAGSIYGVVQGSIADNAKGKVMLRGITNAYVIAASGSIAIGDPLVLATAMNCDLIEAAGEPYHAIALEAATTPTTRTLKKVLFEGIGNFGTFVS